MIRIPFNTGWTAGSSVGLFESFGQAATAPREVHLPHDMLRHEVRDPAGSNHEAYFPSSTVEYVKRFEVGDDLQDRIVLLEFDGVYRDAVVFVNGEYAGQEADGYTRFVLPIHPFLRPHVINEVKVIARTHEDSRWYSGVGIHREVTLLTGPLVHLAVDGVRVTTPDVEPDRAIVDVATTVVNESARTITATVTVGLRDADGVQTAAGTAPVTVVPGETAVVRHRLLVRDVRLWGPESPDLYTAAVTLTDGEDALDAENVTFGVRRLQLDPERGLRINGRTVKLRGACIHHDNGVLGSAAIRRAEERRVELLKAAGFNAIRSAHNPLSSAMLDACDRLGMLVMDESFDVWTESKTAHDYSLRFADWWQRDVDALVRKDFNHPSVIFYSIGNEIVQTGSGLGARWGRLIAERIRSADTTRFITNAINPIFAVGEAMQSANASDLASAMATEDPNEMLAKMDAMMTAVIAGDLVTRLTEESFSVLDAGGLNYGEARYAIDADLFPNRVLIGSETLPTRIAENWPLVEGLDHVLGDFTWTGWDYLGEAGIGRVDYDGGAPGSRAPFPWLTAWTGDIDITGHRRPASYLREIVFGLRHEPYIAVRRPEHHGQPSTAGGWSWSDSISSWSWGVAPGSPTTVEVYSAAAEVELYINGRSCGRQPAGPAHRYTATFEVAWQPGEIVAVDLGDDTELNRTTIRTAGADVAITARTDRADLIADDGDLAHIEIAITDPTGTVATHRSAVVSVEVTGPGVLEGLGSANPATTERFDGPPVTTFDGRALAVVRPSGPGEIVVTVTTDDFDPIVLRLQATSAH